MPEDLLARWEKESSQSADQDGTGRHESNVMEGVPMEQSLPKSVYREIEEAEGVIPKIIFRHS